MRSDLLRELKELAEPALKKDPADRDYMDRYFIWEYERVANAVHHYDEGEEVFIWDGPKLANNEIKDGFGKDFPEWFRDCGKYFGKDVRNRADGKIYTLVGVSYTYRDYYYILESNGRRHFETCLSGIDFLS